jgi:hypothetical protein
MPQDPSALGNMFQPIAQQAGQFGWNLLGQGVAEDIANRRLQKTQEFQAEQAGLAHKRSMELAEHKERLKPPKAWTYKEFREDDEKGKPIYRTYLISPDGTTRIPLQKGTRFSQSVTVNNLLKQPPSEQLNKLQGLYGFRQQLHRMATTWDPKFTGNIEGRLGWLREFTDLPIGIEPDKATQEVVFRQIAKSLRDELLRLKSGAQINEQEYKRLIKLVPDEKMPDRNFMGRLFSLATEFENAIEIRESTLGMVGYQAPKRDPLPKIEDLFPSYFPKKEGTGATQPTTAEEYLKRKGM